MKPAYLVYPLPFSCLILFVTLVSKTNPALSQASNIVPDNTLGDESSQVIKNVQGLPVEVIEGGAQRGQNLFHSFQEFNVKEGREAYFNSPNADIQNIFSRVTGSNPSEIMGVLGTFGLSEPNLFLLNPNGIIFGKNASLDLEGSFFATTANSLIFEDGSDFSAKNPASSLLTITVPLGLQIGSNSGSIINRSTSKVRGASLGLFVEPGKNLTLVGGEINLDGGRLTSFGGRVELGGLSAEGTVKLNEDGSLSFPDDIERANVLLSDAVIEVGFFGGSTRGGDIVINARNLELSKGSRLAAGIIRNLENPNFQSGDIEINATRTVSFSERSIANNLISREDVGNAGDINITTGSLILTDGSFLSVSHRGQQGNSGNVNIRASGLVSIESGVNSGISSIAQQFVGNGGDIIIESPSFVLSNDAQINSSTFTTGDAGNISITTEFFLLTTGGQIGSATLGQGNAGSINITANEEFSFDGTGGGVIINSVSREGIGKGNDIIINTSKLSLSNSARIAASNLGQGSGGNIIINATDSIFLKDDSSLEAITSGRGNAGKINLTTENGTILFDGSFVTTNVDEGGIGNAGNINIVTGSLIFTNNGQLNSNTFGEGNAGNVIVNASDIVSFDGRNGNLPSGILTQVSEEAVGNGGNIEITTNELSLSNGAALSSGTGGKGIGGDVQVQSKNLSMINNAQINSFSLGEGNAGNIIINVINILETKDSEIDTSSDISTGGTINVTAGGILLSGNSNIRTEVNSGIGGGGDIILTADSIIAFDDSDIFAFAEDGQGGDITLNTPVFFAENFTLNSLTSNPDDLEDNSRADINATGAVSGAVSIPDVSFIQNSLTELPANAINTDELVANSCVVRSREQNGTFVITGSSGFPIRPGNANISTYSTGEVRSVPDTESKWQRGEPIVEPQGLYRLTNGKLVLSRECPQKMSNK